MSVDPLTKLYDKIVLEFKKDYKNVISYNTSRGPKPDVPVDAQMGELCLVPDSAVIHIGNASCETTVEQTYQVAVCTGDQRLGQIAFPTMWGLLKTYNRLRYDDANGLGTLTYKGRPYVEDCWPGVASYELGAAQRGMFGWSCLWPVIVRMSFSPEDLT